MAHYPAQLGGNELLVDSVAGFGEELRLIELSFHLRHFLPAAPIALLDRGAQHIAVCIEQHEGRKHAGDADRIDRIRLDAGHREDLAGDLRDVVPPLARVFLGPAGMGRG